MTDASTAGGATHPTSWDGGNVWCEVCCDSIASVRAALKGGARSIELCSGLDLGGLTPTIGLIRSARDVVNEIACATSLSRELHVLVRPRAGDFLYDEDEVQILITDAKQAVEWGADGVVFGVLNSDGTLDERTCEEIIAAVHGTYINRKRRSGSDRLLSTGQTDSPPVLTLHRAVDMSSQPTDTVRAASRLGFNRVLSSGAAACCADVEALSTLQEMVKALSTADKPVLVLPGGGITEQNVRSVVKSVGTGCFHTSAKVTIPSNMQFRPSRNVAMGASNTGSREFEHSVASADRVHKILALANLPVDV